MKVSAKDQATGKDQSMIIQPSGGLSPSEIEKMVKNAEQFREEDRKKKEQVEIKNNLDTKIHNVEKSLNDNKDKLTQDIVSEVESGL